MKTQLKNSQEEVSTGVQGVTSGQKGPKRANEGQKGIIGSFVTILLVKNC